MRRRPSEKRGDTEGCLVKAQAGLDVIVKGLEGSSTGCCALQGMESCASGASPTAQRTFRWHLRAVNPNFGSRLRRKSLGTPDSVLSLTVASPPVAKQEEDPSYHRAS